MKNKVLQGNTEEVQEKSLPWAFWGLRWNNLHNYILVIVIQVYFISVSCHVYNSMNSIDPSHHETDW